MGDADVSQRLRNSRGNRWPARGAIVGHTAARASERIVFHRGGGDVLLLSMRRLDRLVAFCLPYEFEDVVASVTNADRVEPADEGSLELARRVYRLGRAAGRSLARALPRPRWSIELDRDYELFFPVFNHPHELFALRAIRNWRARCRKAACFVSEIFIGEMPDYLLELLSDFDHVFVGVQHPVEAAAKVIGRPCSYLPLAADVERFSPYPKLPERLIDVCNIGRRSPVTHAALLSRAAAGTGLYYFDTVRKSGADGRQFTFSVEDPAEHRQLLAGLLQRSRYYVANRARINQPEQAAYREEISGRFYEGTAAGAVLVGEAPRSEEFRRQFGWTDAVIPMPFDSPDADEILRLLDADPQRVARIRSANVSHAARRHDWVYRLATVLEAVGLAQTADMRRREERLHRLADLAERCAP